MKTEKHQIQFKDRPGIVVFRHDDTYAKNWVTLAMPIYLRYGIQATFFMNTDPKFNPYDVPVCDETVVKYAIELIKNGFEIGSHLAQHYCIDDDIYGKPMPRHNLENLLSMAVEYINNWGGGINGKVASCATPFMRWSTIAEEVVPNYHTNCSSAEQNPMDYPPVNEQGYMHFTSFIVDASKNVDAIKGVILQCMNEQKFVQLMFHNFRKSIGPTDKPEGYDWLDTQLEELCNWCNELQNNYPNKIWFPAMRDAETFMRTLK